MSIVVFVLNLYFFFENFSFHGEYGNGSPNFGSPQSYTQSRPPKDSVCPITSHIFSDPVTLATGQTYERKAIEEWIKRGNTTWLITRQPLSSYSLPKTNYVLKQITKKDFMFHKPWEDRRRNLLKLTSDCGGISLYVQVYNFAFISNNHIKSIWLLVLHLWSFSLTIFLWVWSEKKWVSKFYAS